MEAKRSRRGGDSGHGDSTVEASSFHPVSPFKWCRVRFSLAFESLVEVRLFCLLLLLVQVLGLMPLTSSSKCHVLDFLYDEQGDSELTVLNNGVRFHITVEVGQLSNVPETQKDYLNLLDSVRSQDEQEGVLSGGKGPTNRPCRSNQSSLSRLRLGQVPVHPQPPRREKMKSLPPKQMAHAAHKKISTKPVMELKMHTACYKIGFCSLLARSFKNWLPVGGDHTAKLYMNGIILLPTFLIFGPWMAATLGLSN